MNRPVNCLARTALTALWLTLSAQAAADTVNFSTVGTITQSNQRVRNNRFIVRTPNTLGSFAPSPMSAPDPGKAIAYYDQLLLLQPDPATRAEAMRRSAYLRVELADAGKDPGGVELHKAIATYAQLLAEVPDDPYNDRTRYQLARARELAGDTDGAIADLRHLGADYPHSAFVADGLFRAGELLYARGRYPEAEAAYRVVLDAGTDSNLYAPAQYKYGWALYHQARYTEALPVFFTILEHNLPAGELDDPAAVTAALPSDKAERVGDCLHVISLSLAALGNDGSVGKILTEAHGERFAGMVYAALGSMLLEKHRYSDAAQAYTSFAVDHPSHPLAPTFSLRAVEAYRQGGFVEQIAIGEEDYVKRYAPDAPYWKSASPPAEIIAEVKKDLDELGSYFHARAQAANSAAAGAAASAAGAAAASPTSDVASSSGEADFITAAGWYRRRLELFPNDPQAAETSLHCADALLEGGHLKEAAAQYEQTETSYPKDPKAGEAAFAAIQTYQRMVKEGPASERDDARRQSITAGLALAERFPDHPQWALSLTRAAEDLYELGDLDRATAVAERVLHAPEPSSTTLTPALRGENLAVLADAHFAQNKFPEAESDYTALLGTLDPAGPEHLHAVDRLAAAIYKQGEAARDKGDLRTAADSFERVGKLAPDASLRVNADYDSAAALVELHDWGAAQRVLADFRTRYPDQALIPDVDKKLALAYRNNGQPAQAADAYARIARRTTESADTQRDAALLAAQLYGQAQMSRQEADAYEYYVATFPAPFEAAMQARQHLADLAHLELHDEVRYRYWLRQIMSAADSSGGDRSGDVQLMAAQASLEIGRIDATAAREFAISLPLAKSLPERKAATEVAVAELTRAAGYGFAQITTAATYELGAVYSDFGRALIDSERPRTLKTAEELEQYQLLLEEQADPFQEKAIAAYETNLRRMHDGLWDEWIERSASALVELAPGRFGKHEQRETHYDALL